MNSMVRAACTEPAGYLDGREGSRLHAYESTCGHGMGTVGRAMRTVAGGLHGAMGNAADGSRDGGMGIGTFVESDGFQEVADQSAFGPAGWRAAEMERQFWSDAAAEEPHAIPRATKQLAADIPTWARYGAQAAASLVPSTCTTDT